MRKGPLACLRFLVLFLSIGMAAQAQDWWRLVSNNTVAVSYVKGYVGSVDYEHYSSDTRWGFFVGGAYGGDRAKSTRIASDTPLAGVVYSDAQKVDSAVALRMGISLASNSHWSFGLGVENLSERYYHEGMLAGSSSRYWLNAGDRKKTGLTSWLEVGSNRGFVLRLGSGPSGDSFGLGYRF